MFSLFKKNPIEKLNKQYYQLLEKAMLAQRSGDIRTYSALTADAEALRQQITELENQAKH